MTGRHDFEFYDNSGRDRRTDRAWNEKTGFLEDFRFGNVPLTRKDMESMFKNSRIKEYRGHRNKVHSVAWNSDGRRLASGSVDKTARVWCPHRPKDPSIELKGHTGSVDQLDWDPTHPDRLATASRDKTVRLWDQRTRRCTATIETTGENINIYWSPDGSHIAVGDQNDTISIIDAKTNTIVNSQKSKTEVNEMAWNCANNMFFVATGEGTIKMYDYPSLEHLTTLRGHTANCYCVDSDPTGKYIAAGSADALVTLWDTETFTCIRAFSEHSTPVRAVGFSFDGQFIASASEGAFIDISYVDSGESVHHIQCTTEMNAVAWHPRDYYLAFAGDDKASDGSYTGDFRIFNISNPLKKPA